MFEQVGINRVEASHAVNNPASGRVTEKAGFGYEGLAKEYCRCAPNFQNSRLFAFTRGAYRRGPRG